MRFSVLLLLLLVSVCDAGERRGRRASGGGSSEPMHMVPGPYTGKDSSQNDALAEVNAARAKYNLKPFLPDAGLTKAANACAEKRASRHIAGHLPESDFTCVPSGTTAKAAGAGAWDVVDGWGACCTYSTEYTHAGCAWRMGTDNKRYMSIFVY